MNVFWEFRRGVGGHMRQLVVYVSRIKCWECAIRMIIQLFLSADLVI